MFKEEKIEEIGELSFGDYAIVGAHEHEFKKIAGVTWTIKPVTSGAEVARSKFLMYNRIAETIDGVRYEQPPTALEIAHRELALLYGGTTLALSNGKPVLRDNPTTVEIEGLLAKMPPEMVQELWIQVGQLYPKWGPADPKEWMEEN